MSAQASLVLLGSTPISGAGLGNVSTILTLQSPASSTIEGGCVLPGATPGTGTQCSAFGSSTAFAAGTVQTGASQIGSPTLGSLGITRAEDLRIILNATEPAANSIVVEQLVLNLFNGAIVLGTTHTLAAPQTIANTQTGVGNAGFAFALNTAEAIAVNALLNALPSATRNAVQIGLAARISDAAGGPETFFAANAGALPPPVGAAAIPEPASVALVGSALLAAGLLRRRPR
ncbi:MAG TPA: PEP-CTERM sorting domain-containing protein [Bryobacteraceae bacterium]|nr:PEP-CTERM sorting domain-containing protein [Bryobacteraceae bacterium]